MLSIAVQFEELSITRTASITDEKIRSSDDNEN